MGLSIRSGLPWAAALSIAACVPAAQAGRHYQILHSFNGSEGSASPGDLVFDAAGNMYGTLGTGGAHENGAIFKMSPVGDFTLLYSFTGGSDGGGPAAGLALDPATGDLYGTNTAWGAHHDGCVFKLTPAGQLVVLKELDPDIDGNYAAGPLMRDSQGNFYGTTSQGAAYGNGAVFEITAGGEYALVHALTGPEGAGTYGRLLLHGTDLYGGGGGSIYDYNLDGTVTVVGDVANTGGTVARDGKGNIYGGSSSGEDGYIYKIVRDGTISTLYAFTGGTDGRYPEGNMLFFKKRHMLYGTTTTNGSYNGGIFSLDLKGHFTIMHDFAGAPRDASFPKGGLVERNGRLYGTTLSGGANDLGAIYSISIK
jgi:uncharacterized repeat protein (TIGR03803 family)